MNNERQRFTLRIPKELHKILKIAAIDALMDMNQFVIKAIEEKIEKKHHDEV